MSTGGNETRFAGLYCELYARDERLQEALAAVRGQLQGLGGEFRRLTGLAEVSFAGMEVAAGGAVRAIRNIAAATHGVRMPAMGAGASGQTGGGAGADRAGVGAGLSIMGGVSRGLQIGAGALGSVVGLAGQALSGIVGVAAGIGRQAASFLLAPFTGVFQTLGMLWRNAFSIFGVLAVGGLTKAVMAASDLNEAVNLATETFGASAPKVIGWANQFSDAFGLPKKQLLDMSGAFGSIFQGAGIAQDQAARLSTQMTTLAADAMSFRNVSLEEAFAKIQAGLAGEMEPLRRWGVLLDMDSVNAEMARQSAAGLSYESTNQAKIMARLSLITRGLAKDTGDLARTAKDPANAMRILAGRAQNLATDFGATLQPAFRSLLGVAGDALSGIAGFFERNRATFEEWGVRISGWLEKIPQFLAPMVAGFTSMLSTIGGAIGQATGISRWQGWIAAIGTVLTTARDYIEYFFLVAATVLPKVVEFVWPVIASFWGLVESIGGAVVGLVKFLTTNQTVGTIVTWLRDLLIGAFDNVSFVVRNLGDLGQILGIQFQAGLTHAVETAQWFGQVMGATITWVATNWRTIFSDLFEMITTALINLGTNFKNFGASVYNWVTSGFQQPFDFKATPLGQGMAAMQTPQMVLPKRQLTDFSDQIAEVTDRIAGREVRRNQEKAARAAALATGDVEGVTVPTKPGGAPRPPIGPEEAPEKPKEAEMMGISEMATSVLKSAFKPQDQQVSELQKMNKTQDSQLVALNKMAEGGLTARLAGPE